MNPTKCAAWVGAITGLAGLGWNIYLKLSSGPKLTVVPLAHVIIIPAEPGDPNFISISITNQGTAPTTITNLGLCIYDSWWAAKRRKGSQYFVVKNSELPLKLEVGEEWRPEVRQDDRIDNLLKSNKLWVTVSHAFSKRPAQAKVPHEKKRFPSPTGR